MAPTTFSLSQDQIKHFNITGRANSDVMDLRMIQFLDLKKWKLYSVYKDKRVDIPGFPGSSFHLVKYFQVVKRPGEPFYNESQEENEIGLTLWAGWPGYDHEVEINLFIRGKDVLNGAVNTTKVSAEILKAGSAHMVLTFDKKIVTAFKQKTWFGTKKLDKVWIDDMTKFL